MLLRVLRDGGTPANAAKRAGEMFNSINGKLYQKAGEKVACQPGCAYCCVVHTHRHEVGPVARELRARLGPDGIADLKHRIQAVIDGRARGDRPWCALLRPDDRCTVYAVRPLYCRSCNSPDANECRAYEQQGDETPRRTFALPMIFADYTYFAANTILDPKLTPASYPTPGELMASLLREL